MRKPKLLLILLPVLLLVLAQPVDAQTTVRRPASTFGPRFGFTLHTGESADALKDDFNASPVNHRRLPGDFSRNHAPEGQPDHPYRPGTGVFEERDEDQPAVRFQPQRYRRITCTIDAEQDQASSRSRLRTRFIIGGLYGNRTRVTGVRGRNRLM